MRHFSEREGGGGEIVKKGKEGWQRGDLVARGKAYHKVIVGMGGGGGDSLISKLDLDNIKKNKRDGKFWAR